MAGRPPKPTAVHKLQGTHRKHRHGTRHDLELGGELPQPPDFLPEAAREEWLRVCTISRYSKALSPADRGPLTVYCLMWCEIEAKTRGGEEVQSSRLRTFATLAGKFGMTPADRAKVQMPEEPKSANKFAALREENPLESSPAIH